MGVHPTSWWEIMLDFTLTEITAKWYIELQSTSIHYFSSLEDLLTHFQLPIHYETITKLLTSLH